MTSGALLDKIKDIPEISASEAIDALGGGAAYEKIIAISVKMLPEAIERLNALINDDLPLYSIEAHGIKGVLKSIGAFGLADLAFELERISKGAVSDGITDKHTHFCALINEFLERLAPVFQKDAAPGKTESGNVSFLISRLPLLKDTILNYNHTEALEELTRFSRKTYGQTADAAISAAIESLEHFNYSKAADILGALDEELCRK